MPKYDFEVFFNLSPEMLCIAGVDGCFQQVNPSFERVLGRTSAQLSGQNILAFVHPDDADATQKELDKLAREGIPAISFENRYRCADGSYRHFSWSARREANAKLFFAVANDITDKKQSAGSLRRPANDLKVADEALETRIEETTRELTESRNRLKSMLDHLPIVLWESGARAGFAIKYIGENTEAVHGYSSQFWKDNPYLVDGFYSPGRFGAGVGDL